MKQLAVGLALIGLASSAFATATLIISDGSTSVTITDGGVGDASPTAGVVIYSNPSFDNSWSLVVNSGETKPALGSASTPLLDLTITATSLSKNPVRNLSITFSDNGFGPPPSGFLAQLSGHVVSGLGQNVSFNSYVDAGNVTAATTTLLTASGTLAPPVYSSVQSGTASGLALYSITEVVTINGTPNQVDPGSYSIDASLTGVPDGGTTVMLLGAALSGLAFLRRKTA